LWNVADGYPDPKTGKPTAISSALLARYVQVFVVHPEKSVVETTPPSARGAGDARR
jgi:hypothetical protein